MERIRERVTQVAQNQSIVAVYLFGSQARGTARSNSDIDLAVVFANGCDPVERLGICGQLQEQLGSAYGMVVDVVDLNGTTDDLREQVLRYGQLLFSGDHRQRIQYEVSTRQRIMDFAPYRHFYRKRMLQQLARRAEHG